MKQFKLIAILILIICVACSNEEPLIDNSITDVSFVIQRNSNTLEMLDFKDNKPVFTPIELEKNIGKIELIKKFRGKYYLVNKQMKQLFVLENIYAPNITEINFNYSNLILEDMCFPNATDCYVIDRSSNLVRIIDITTNEFSNITIELPSAGSSIAGIGNQVYVTIPSKNLVVIIDTRTNTITDQISVAGKPSIVDFSYNGKFAIIVSIGEGKEPPYNQTTPAMISTIDLETKKVTRNNVFTGNETTASKLIPNTIVVSDRYIYISATNIDGGAGGYRISSSNYTSTSVVVRNSCNNVIKSWNCPLFIENKNQELNCLLYNTNNKLVSDINIGSEFNSGCEK